MRAKELFDVQLRYTETYRQYENEHIAIREAMCIQALYPSLFTGIQEGDLFAGRIQYGVVGFGLEQDAGGAGGYGIRPYQNEITAAIENAGLEEVYRKKLWDMVEFWQKESTVAKSYRSLPSQLRKDVTNPIASSGGIRLAGVLLDFDRLLHLGLPGLAAEVKGRKETALQEGRDVKLYEGMLLVLDTFLAICREYAGQARELAAAASEAERNKELLQMAEILEGITERKPGSLREAIQLFWLYSLLSGVVNYGRMDVYLGDFLSNDLVSGALTEEKALQLLQSLWKLIADRRIVFNGRIIIGGKGRRNEENADRFALLAMEATRLVVETEPQLSLRFYKGMNPSLMKKALDVIGEGRIYPMLYNDDVNVPAVQTAFGVKREEAEQYLPYGCGEYVLDHISIGSPNCVLNLLKALEATLHNGRNGLTGEPMGLQTGEFTSFTTYEELLGAYKKQVAYFTRALAERHAHEYKAERENAAYLFVSMLYDHCLERGKSIVDGGARYTGGIVESFGIVNVADSLAAIKQLVYDRKILTRAQLLDVLDANFTGYEAEHKLMLNVPKYGNDDAYVDTIAQEISNHVCAVTREQAAGVGLDYFLVVNINNFVNVTIGKGTAASADGRKAGDPYANGSTPTAGMDRSGITALLNSLAKLDPSQHAGYVYNMKFSKRMFNEERSKLEVLLQTYFQKGGTQAMITVVSRGDLENALLEPEKYANLMVRVGGYSARFVELPVDVQRDILNRTLY